MNERSSVQRYFGSPDFRMHLVIGMSDGLIVPFAVIAGLTAARQSGNVIMLVTAVVTLLAAVILGLGAWLASRSEIHQNARHNSSGTATAHHSVQQFFAKIDLPVELQQQAAIEFDEDRKEWASFHARNDLQLSGPEPFLAAKSGLTVFLSYVAGGLISLAPTLFFPVDTQRLLYTFVLTLVSLAILGVFRSFVNGQPGLKYALRSVIIGAAAGGAGYWLGLYFGNPG